MGKILSSKYGKKLLDNTKKISNRCIPHCLKKGYPKTAETTGNLVGNKISGKITKAASKSTFGEPRKWPAKADETSIQPM